MNAIKNLIFQLKRYFTLNRSEHNGILILIGITIISWVISFIYTQLKSPEQMDFNLFKNEITEFQKGLVLERIDEKRKEEADNKHYEKSNKNSELHPFNFNPNHLSPEKWKQLGLSKNQIKTILHYEEKGGKFYKKEDLKKIYSISQAEYDILEPFITIPESRKDTFYVKENYAKKAPIHIELNSADTSELVLLKGIGSGFAKSIVKYREKLGGFYHKNQLLEVWGMDSVRLNKIYGSVSVNPSLIRKININAGDIKSLMKHPYIDFYLARSIINYRKLNGRFTSLQQIQLISGMYKELYAKLEPYLTLN